MYILWYSPELGRYSVDRIDEGQEFSLSNGIDVLYRFSINEKAVAFGVLRNLNVASLNAL